MLPLKTWRKVINEKFNVLDVNSIEQGAFVSLHFLYKKIFTSELKYKFKLALH